jgi:stage V sporulation protein D (sporulation-specific penicillin-binding protein)
MSKRRQRIGSGRLANRKIFRRTVFLLVVCGVLMFLPIFYQLWHWQVVRHDELQEKAVRQQTSELSVSAERGTIFDCSGNVLAISSSAYDVILSPKAIAEKQVALEEAKTQAQEAMSKAIAAGNEVKEEVRATAEDPVPDVVELIAKGLPKLIPGVDKKDIREKCKDTNSQYKKIATKLDATTEQAVRAFISEHKLAQCVYLTPNSKRAYPYSTLAAQIIGFTNDNGGAYGIEAELEKELAGKAGLVVTAHNAGGTDLMNFYQDYYDPEDGDSAYLTIDANIQKLCEDALAQGVERYDVRNGGFIIAMDCKNGAIRGMASSPSYDLNDYSKIIDDTLKNRVKGGKLSEADALNIIWRNKALNDTYEPGSTFKSIVLASAMEEGLIDENSHFNCDGAVKVANYTIRCSNHAGHGNQTLAEAVGHSCNPAFISIGQKLGEDTFYSYMERFGLMEPTNVDLPGESANVIWGRNDFGITQLATASFGQRFNVTPISLITAINAVVNGGYLYRPHVVDRIVSPEGQVLYRGDTTPVRQVISEETSQRCASILEGVVTNYTGKNAYVPGYRIGGKTGTSQTLVEDEYIASFMGFAPADDPQIIVLVAFEAPKVAEPGSDYSTTGYYISGGNMAAPIAGQLIAEILDYQGFDREYTSDDLSVASTTVPAVTGMDENEAKETLKNRNLNYRKVGSGETVTAQCPLQGASIPSESEVILYMGVEAPKDRVTMPDLTGLTVDQVRETLAGMDLYLTATGSSSYYNSATLAYHQSVKAGEKVERGSVVTVAFTDHSVGDYAGQEIDD